jgi:iron complex transport system ATP-binding protein
MTAIEFSSVSAGYHGTPVLTDIDLRIEQGELVGLLGPNGAGKTTFLRCITGLCRPLKGGVRLFGEELNRLPADERARRVAVVPQEVDTPVAFTVQEIVMIGRTASLSRWSRPARRDWKVVERAMVYTDIAELKHRPYGELSGGEKQRVIVAMALAQEPRVILMDEATSHLDINHRLELMQIVERLNAEGGVTVLMISHDLNLAAEFCRRLLLLHQGRVVADGAPRDVLREDLLRRVYRCDVRVGPNPTNGTVNVFPAPRLTAERSGTDVRVHVIGGGGTAEEVLRRLVLCRYTVTCGVTNQGDTDAEVAALLGVETAMEKPFSPISAGALEAARALMQPAQAVVVCGMPFGTGNAANLQLAEEALAAGKRVLIMDGVQDRDYTPDRRATARAEALVRQGAVTWQHVADLIDALPGVREARP